MQKIETARELNNPASEASSHPNIQHQLGKDQVFEIVIERTSARD